MTVTFIVQEKAERPVRLALSVLPPVRAAAQPTCSQPGISDEVRGVCASLLDRVCSACQTGSAIDTDRAPARAAGDKGVFAAAYSSKSVAEGERSTPGKLSVRCLRRC